MFTERIAFHLCFTSLNPHSTVTTSITNKAVFKFEGRFFSSLVDPVAKKVGILGKKT